MKPRQSKIKADYKTTVELLHEQSLLVIDNNTGEITAPKITNKSVNKPPKGLSVFKYKDFYKVPCNTNEVLQKLLTKPEFWIVGKMQSLADYHTNSLRPLNNNTTIKELSKVFDISINHTKGCFERLYVLGIYSQFKISKYGEMEYWVLNPYISFKGGTIDDSLFLHFEGTIITDLIKYGKTSKNIDHL